MVHDRDDKLEPVHVPSLLAFPILFPRITIDRYTMRRMMHGLPKPLNWLAALVLMLAAMAVVPIFATYL